MSKILIKICGITEATLAKNSALAGANFIGLVFHPTSKRVVTLAQAKAISTALLDTQAKPVAVFTEHSALEIQEICEECHIQIVQLQGERSRSEHHLLPQHYQRIYAQSILSYGSINKKDAEHLKFCNDERDYLLFDHATPGSGINFNWNQFHYHGSFKSFVAGGLTPFNVAEAVKTLLPAGVDVSSGVENSLGEKDLELIKKFISEVHKL